MRTEARNPRALDRPGAAAKTPGMVLRPDHRPSTLIRKFRALPTVIETGELDSLLSADVVIEDRRNGPGQPMAVPNALVERIRTLSVQGPGALNLELVALRGDRFALARASSLRPDGDLSSSLVVSEVSVEGQVLRLLFHDLDDVGGAVRSLAELFIESLDPASAATMLTASSTMYALAGRSFVRARALIADDLRHVDYRESPPFVTDAEGLMDGVQLILADDELIDIVREVLAINGRGLVVSRAQVMPDTLEELGSEVLLVGVRAGLLDVTEIYQADELGRALARLEELGEE